MNALHIDGMVQKIVPALSDNHCDKKVEIHLRDILFTTEDMTRRVIITPHAHISKLCLSLTSVVARLKQPASESEIQDVRILPKLSAAIKIAFEDTENTAETASRISVVIEAQSDCLTGYGDPPNPHGDPLFISAPSKANLIDRSLQKEERRCVPSLIL